MQGCKENISLRFRQQENIFTTWRLRLESENIDLSPRDGHVRFNFSLLPDPSNDNTVIMLICIFTVTRTAPHLKSTKRTFRHERLYSNDDLPSSSLIHNVVFIDTISRARQLKFILYEIKYEIRFLGTSTFSNDARYLAGDLSSVMSNEEFSDVVLVSEDKQQFRAHRCVLAARSIRVHVQARLGREPGRCRQNR